MPCLSFRVRFCSRQLSFVHRLRLRAWRVFIDVDPDVDDGTLTAGDPFARFFQRGTNLARLAHRDAPATETVGEFLEIHVAKLISHAAALGTILTDLAAADLIHR